MNDILYDVLVESIHKSNIDKGFKPKSSKNIKTKTLDIHSSEAKKYIDNDLYLSGLGKKLKKFKGEIIVDLSTEKIIGRFLIGTGKDDGFIGALRVSDKYKGYGFGNQLVHDAIHKYGGTDLVVLKDNEIALKLYKKHEFVIVKCSGINNKTEYYMKLKSALSDDDKVISESAIYDMIFDKIHEKLNSGELSLETSNKINELAYEKYMK